MKLKLTFALLAGSLCINAQNKLPDLMVEKINAPEYVDSAGIFGTVVKVTIKNNGKAASTAVKAKLYDLDISLEEAKKLGVEKEDYWIFEENTERAKEGYGGMPEDITPYDYDKYVEDIQQIPALEPKQSIEITFMIEGHWVYDSNCEIEVYVDFDNQLKESNEDNNKLQFFAGG